VVELSLVGQDRSELHHGVSLRKAFRTWLRVASRRFGGPAPGLTTWVTTLAACRVAGIVLYLLGAERMSGRAIALRTISAALLAAWTVAPAVAVDGKASIDLGENRIGTPPEDFDFGITGRGQPGQWTVVRDVTAINGVAIEQSSEDPTENRFLFATYKPLSLKNLAANIRLKLIKGTMQTAGIAFRFANSDNYYVVNASALEERVDLFRVLGGKMERIGGADAEVVLNHWHTLSLVAEGDQFTVSLDKNWLFTARDRTFLVGGRIGLWTEEDNITRFDQLAITALPWSEER
jgi:hypothetical protein